MDLSYSELKAILLPPAAGQERNNRIAFSRERKAGSKIFMENLHHLAIFIVERN